MKEEFPLAAFFLKWFLLNVVFPGGIFIVGTVHFFPRICLKCWNVSATRLTIVVFFCFSFIHLWEEVFIISTDRPFRCTVFLWKCFEPIEVPNRLFKGLKCRFLN